MACATSLGDHNKQFITSYSNLTGPEAWGHISTAYDNSNVLHIIWDEQLIAGTSQDVAIRHWNDSRRTIRTVAQSDWPSPTRWVAQDLHLSKMTLGIGDGATPCQSGTESNSGYLYVVYTQFGGPTPAEQADFSAAVYYNGELHLAVSRDGGNSWSRTQNVTNTKTPGCNPGSTFPYSCQCPRPDSVCRSEHWATIGKIVHDIDIFFISDLDAGAIAWGEGTWQCSPVMYLRLPGGTTDAPYLCPPLEPLLSTEMIPPDTSGYHGTCHQQDSAALILGNHGNWTLEGSVTAIYTDPQTPPTQWLTINGQQTTTFSIPAGSEDETLHVAMSASGLPPGTYRAIVSVWHNDTTQVSPVNYPFEFWVGDCVCHGDPLCDSVTNLQDVVAVINEAFRGGAPIVDSLCPHASRGDVNCDCTASVVDVVLMVNHAFRGDVTPFCQPCNRPCQ
ncbi:MAG: hypothetical protein AB1792_11255 [Candidatus Zixiibacteriota bacterium]